MPLQNFQSRFSFVSDPLQTLGHHLVARNVRVPAADRLMIAMSEAGRALAFLLDFVAVIGIDLQLRHSIEIQNVAPPVQSKPGLLWQVQRLAFHRQSDVHKEVHQVHDERVLAQVPDVERVEKVGVSVGVQDVFVWTKREFSITENYH